MDDLTAEKISSVTFDLVENGYEPAAVDAFLGAAAARVGVLTDALEGSDGLASADRGQRVHDRLIEAATSTAAQIISEAQEAADGRVAEAETIYQQRGEQWERDNAEKVAAAQKQLEELQADIAAAKERLKTVFDARERFSGELEALATGVLERLKQADQPAEG